MKQKAGWGLAGMGVVVFVIVEAVSGFSLSGYLGVAINAAGLVTTGVLNFEIIAKPVIG